MSIQSIALNGVPDNVLQQAIMGGVPNIQPYAALGELNQRNKSKQMQVAQANQNALQQPPQPPIAQQVMQQGNALDQGIAGLMQRQAMAPQQMQEPRRFAEGGIVSDYAPSGYGNSADPDLFPEGTPDYSQNKRSITDDIGRLIDWFRDKNQAYSADLAKGRSTDTLRKAGFTPADLTNYNDWVDRKMNQAPALPNIPLPDIPADQTTPGPSQTKPSAPANTRGSGAVRTKGSSNPLNPQAGQISPASQLEQDIRASRDDIRKSSVIPDVMSYEQMDTLARQQAQGDTDRYNQIMQKYADYNDKRIAQLKGQQDDPLYGFTAGAARLADRGTDSRRLGAGIATIAGGAQQANQDLQGKQDAIMASQQALDQAKLAYQDGRVKDAMAWQQRAEDIKTKMARDAVADKRADLQDLRYQQQLAAQERERQAQINAQLESARIMANSRMYSADARGQGGVDRNALAIQKAMQQADSEWSKLSPAQQFMKNKQGITKAQFIHERVAPQMTALGIDPSEFNNYYAGTSIAPGTPGTANPSTNRVIDFSQIPK